MYHFCMHQYRMSFLYNKLIYIAVFGNIFSTWQKNKRTDDKLYFPRVVFLFSLWSVFLFSSKFERRSPKVSPTRCKCFNCSASFYARGFEISTYKEFYHFLLFLHFHMWQHFCCSFIFISAKLKHKVQNNNFFTVFLNPDLLTSMSFPSG